MGARTLEKLVSPTVFLTIIGAVFYGLLNILFKFHLAADDFTYLGNYWVHVDDPSLDNVIGSVVIRQPIYLLQYFLIRLSPNSTNLYYFAFQLLHTINAVLLYKLVTLHLRPYLPAPVNMRLWNDPALLAGLLFLLYPNNYEVLYWRTCISYSLGMTAALAGMVLFSRLSIVLWLTSFLCYETFLFFPAFLFVPILLARRSGKGGSLSLTPLRLLGRYSASLLMYGTWRVISARIWEAPMSRYSMDLGIIEIPKRFIKYLVFHLSVCSSLTVHWVPTVILWLLLLYVVWRSWGWLRANRWLVFATAGVYLLALLPVASVAHFSPRGSFAAGAVMCAFLGLLLATTSRLVTATVLALFISGHVLGAIRADFNSRLYLNRVDRIAETVADLETGREIEIEVRNFDRGYRREWFLQIGFSMDVIENELKHRFPDRRFDLVPECPKEVPCVRLDFSAE